MLDAELPQKLHAGISHLAQNLQVIYLLCNTEI